MIVFWGVNSVRLGTEKLEQEVCGNCGSGGNINLSVYRKHAHIFWLPLFPVGKRGRSECGHCRQVLTVKEMPDSLKQEYTQLKRDLRGPIWQFGGLILLVGLVVAGIINLTNDRKNELKYISSPQKGDVYEYKIERGSYSTLKVDSVSKDSVYMIPNQYEISKVTKVHRIDKDENYADFSYGISRKELEKMYDSGDIIDIKRK